MRFSFVLLALFLTANFVVSEEEKPITVVLFGPSGVGKTTRAKAVVDVLKSKNIEASIFRNYTTRPPRRKELSDEYLFVSKKRFHDLRRQNKIIAECTEDLNLYGTPVLSSSSSEKVRIITASRVLAAQLKEKIESVVFIHLIVSGDQLATLKQRVKKRGANTEDQIARRMVCAENELAAEKGKPIADFTVLNENSEKSIKEIVTVVERSILQMNRKDLEEL